MIPLLSDELAELAGSTGALLAASHADRKSQGWSEDALSFFELYANQKPDGFLTEDVRVWAEKMGFPPPPDERAWGHIAKKAAKKGMVVPIGYAKARSSNNSPKVLWSKP